MKMTEQEVFEKLLPLIQEVTGLAEDRIRMESCLMEDLGAESLDLLDLSFLIEETFGVMIASDEFERRANEQTPAGEYERDGLLTEEGVAKLRLALPEVPPEKIQPGMPRITVPKVLTVGVFVHLIERKLVAGSGEVQEQKLITGKGLLCDPIAPSADPDLPGFLARPADAPVYHGFPIIPESETDGWVYGAITAFDTAEPQTEGDGYVIAPDGSRAGIVWANDTDDFYEIMPPDHERWGVYGVCFPRPVSSLQDIIFDFRAVLPKLQERFARLKANRNQQAGNTGKTYENRERHP
jgi:acyl carrier protein